MSKIKRFKDLNESFNPQKEEIEGRPYYKMVFKLGDISSSSKLINFDIYDFEDKENTMMHYTVNDQYPPKHFSINGSVYVIEGLYIQRGKYSSHVGWIVLKNDTPTFIVGIYEPHGESINKDREMITFWGHEEIINLWLDNGEYDKMHTR